MTKHTPGPWKAHLNAPTAVIPGHLIKTDDDVEHPIALLWEGGGTKGKPEQKANALLIAQAPRLLEALKIIRGRASMKRPAPYKELVAIATAAIAATEGK